MRIIVVGGPHSGVGKTLAAEIALRTLRQQQFGAIKLTVADGEFDPAHDHGASALAVADAAGICGRGASCGVCETVSARVPSRTITSPGAIGKPNTDTWRLANAGAVAVVWIIALRQAAEAAVDAAIRHLAAKGANGVVIEGTTSLEWIKPDVSVMVATNPARKWKDVAIRHVGRCDIVLQNFPPGGAGTDMPPPEFFAARPVQCDLGDPENPGTHWYVARLRELSAAKAAATSAR